MSTEWPNRFLHLDKILTRDGPFTQDFTPGEVPQSFLRNQCKILVIGEIGLALIVASINMTDLPSE